MELINMINAEWSKLWMIFSLILEIPALVLGQFMCGECLNLIWEKIHKANKKEVHTSGLLTWIGTWPHSWLFIQKAETRYSVLSCTKASHKWVKSWKCENGSNKKNNQMMSMAFDEKMAQKRNGVWLQDLQCLFVQRWLPLCTSQSTTAAENSKHFLVVFCCF